MRVSAVAFARVVVNDVVVVRRGKPRRLSQLDKTEHHCARCVDEASVTVYLARQVTVGTID